MNRVLCPHCHVALQPGEPEEVAVDGRRYLICPECDTPLPLPEPLPGPSPAHTDPGLPDA